MAFSSLFSIFFMFFLGRNSPNDPQNFSTLAVSKMLAASSFLPNLTIIGAQSHPCGAKEPKKANKSNFNIGLSAGNKKFFVNFLRTGICPSTHLPQIWQVESLSQRNEL